MINTRVNHDLRTCVALHALLHGFDGRRRNIAVLICKMKKDGAADMGCAIQLLVDTSPVVTDGGIDAGVGRGDIAEEPSHAETQ